MSKTKVLVLLTVVIVVMMVMMAQVAEAYPKNTKRNINMRERRSKPPPSQPWINPHDESEEKRSGVKLDPLPFNQNQTYLRVLAMDGGGIRGLLSSRILVAVEEKIKEKTNNPNAKLSDYFDVISGTSVGGIAALSLLAGYNASQITEIWYSNANNIFGSSMAQWMGPAIDSAYSPEGLEKVLQHYLGSETLMSKTYSNRSYAIVSFDCGYSGSAVFTRSSVVENGDFFSWQVGRSTSAAPTYFPTAFITSQTGKNFTFIDGGIIANNPSLIALSVAAEDFPRVSISSTVLLSIGTGIIDTLVQGYHDWGYEPWFFDGDLIDLVFNGPMYAVEDTVSRLFNQAGTPSQYLRVQYSQNTGINGLLLPDCQKADFTLDDVDPSNLNLLVSCGDQIAAAYSSSLDQIVSYLVATRP